jgi:hypothetical protein
MLKLTVVLGRAEEPQYFTGYTFDWPEGIYIPAPGETNAFPAIVRSGSHCYAVRSESIYDQQAHVSNKYVKAPRRTYIMFGESNG